MNVRVAASFVLSAFLASALAAQTPVETALAETLDAIRAVNPFLRQCSNPPTGAPVRTAPEALEAVVRFLRQCPEALESETPWGANPAEVERRYAGPATEVTPAAGPDRGVIEFRLSRRRWVAPDLLAAYERARASAVRDDDGETLRFRYEFELGEENIALRRVLSRPGSLPLWLDAGKEDICWDDSARTALPIPAMDHYSGNRSGLTSSRESRHEGERRKSAPPLIPGRREGRR